MGFFISHLKYTLVTIILVRGMRYYEGVTRKINAQVDIKTGRLKTAINTKNVLKQTSL